MIRRPPRSTRKESSAASDVYKRQEQNKADSIMIRRPPRSTRKESSAASDVYKRQVYLCAQM
ncbi:hypothetical protein, partial [Staphylococcus aureus]